MSTTTTIVFDPSKDPMKIKTGTAEDSWECYCGNQPHLEGFRPYPEEDLNAGLWKCDRCDRVYTISGYCIGRVDG